MQKAIIIGLAFLASILLAILVVGPGIDKEDQNRHENTCKFLEGAVTKSQTEYLKTCTK